MPEQAPHRNFSAEISTSDYNSQRLDPAPAQELYLHLSDLRDALETVRTDAKISILDYGCGGSPYATLFPNADYRRADYLETGSLDYLLGADSRIAEKDGVFDRILSTQVLEHVQQPAIYLSECYRLLKPGGRVILTTHGTYPEHGCPYDYQRWTADGLRALLETNGFRIVTLKKLTVGPRALFFLLGTSVPLLYGSKATVFGLCLRILRRILSRSRSWIQTNCDRCFAQHRQVDTGSPGDNSLYIALFVVAEKP